MNKLLFKAQKKTRPNSEVSRTGTQKGPCSKSITSSKFLIPPSGERLGRFVSEKWSFHVVKYGEVVSIMIM
jgi:hypothetical protein